MWRVLLCMVDQVFNYKKQNRRIFSGQSYTGRVGVRVRANNKNCLG